MDNFPDKVREIRNAVLNRPEYREARNALEKRVQMYNREQQLEQKQAVQVKDEEDLEK